tara:strand:+ start:622 stop:822 length:201 start_codon:yes stop_codon:yes gene_type:complete
VIISVAVEEIGSNRQHRFWQSGKLPEKWMRMKKKGFPDFLGPISAYFSKAVLFKSMGINACLRGIK